jgi:hypothetical protein
MMMQPTDFWHFPDQTNVRPLDRPRHRTIHIQAPVRAPAMIILEVRRQEPPHMSLVQDDHVIQAFAADTPDEPLNVRILPRAPGGDHHFFDPHVSHPLPKVRAIDTVTIAQEIPWCFVPWERVHHLLSRPRCGGVYGDVDMHEASSLVGQNQ